LTPDQEALLADWQEVKEQRDAFTARERVLRDRVVKSFFPMLAEATSTADLGDGWKLKAVGKINRTVKLDENFPWPAWLTPDHFSKLFPEKRTLAEGEWKQLSTLEKASLSALVTEKEGTSSLEIVGPK
jgi:hypothetical protein